MVFRDPDGVIDRSDVEFGDLNDLEYEDGVETIADRTGGVSYHAPGIWLKTGINLQGEVLYKRAFSTDDKPYSSKRGGIVLSPLINKLTNDVPYYDVNATFAPVADSNENKYSISTAYLKQNGDVVKGFVSNIGTIVQNLSATPSNGGFVYHRTLTSQTISNVKGYPLFDYYDPAGNIQSPYILVDEGSTVDNEPTGAVP